MKWFRWPQIGIVFLSILVVQIVISWPGMPGQIALAGWSRMTSFAAQKQTGDTDSSVVIPFVARNYAPPYAYPILGVEFSRNPREEETLPDLLSAGNGWLRYGVFRWDQIEPENSDPPVYDWGAIPDALLEEMSLSGVRIIGTITLAPTWARAEASPPCAPILEENLSDFSDFLTALVGKYSQPPYNIRYWELGNEPDAPVVTTGQTFGCWGDPDQPDFGAAAYTQMLHTAYPAIKSADPRSRVILGGLLLGEPTAEDYTMGRFLSGILDQGGAAYFDIVNFHAYDYYGASLGKYSNGNWSSSSLTTGPVVLAKAAWLKAILQAYGVDDKPIINTETGLLCDTGCNESYELTKAYYLAESMASARAAGLSANIWYSWFGWRNDGLINPTNLTLLPAYQAYKTVASKIGGSEYLGPITASDLQPATGILGYRFRSGSSIIWLVWAQSAETINVTLPGTPLSSCDVFGDDISIDGNQLTLTVSPVYLEWSS